MRPLLACLAVFLLANLAAAAPAKPLAVKLWRLDCGALWVADMNEYSDTLAFAGRSIRMADSCYLIRHGETYMLWDTGLPKADLGKTLKEGADDNEAYSVSIIGQLARIGVKPGQITLIAISHAHFDHIGQAADFPAARLLIGKGDVDFLRADADPEDAAPLAHWLTGGGTIKAISGDVDIFGDGTVTMIDLPGHTAGHHGLMVRLAHTGPVLLSGDVAHFRENLETNGVPPFNDDRARSIASMDRFRTLAKNLGAVAIIQHDERDVAKLPAFPAGAE